MVLWPRYELRHLWQWWKEVQTNTTGHKAWQKAEQFVLQFCLLQTVWNWRFLVNFNLGADLSQKNQKQQKFLLFLVFGLWRGNVNFQIQIFCPWRLHKFRLVPSRSNLGCANLSLQLQRRKGEKMDLIFAVFCCFFLRQWFQSWMQNWWPHVANHDILRCSGPIIMKIWPVVVELHPCGQSGEKFGLSCWSRFHVAFASCETLAVSRRSVRFGGSPSPSPWHQHEA